MKKLMLILVAGIMACATVSCNGKSGNSETINDSLPADSVDTIATTVIDSVDTVMVSDTLVNE